MGGIGPRASHRHSVLDILLEAPWIFRSKQNPGMRLTRLNGAHDRLCAKASKEGVSLKFVLYDFRHTFATRLAQAGIDLATLAAILGHNSIRICSVTSTRLPSTSVMPWCAVRRNSQSWPGGKQGPGRQAQLTVKILGTFCPPLRSKVAHFRLSGPIEREGRKRNQLHQIQPTTRKVWRRGSESNRRIKVLQTSPLPLGYRAPAQYVSVPCGKSLPAGKIWLGRKNSGAGDGI